MQSGSRRGAPLTAVWDTEKTCESRRCGKTGRTEDCADFVPKAEFAGKRRAEAAAVRWAVRGDVRAAAAEKRRGLCAGRPWEIGPRRGLGRAIPGRRAGRRRELRGGSGLSRAGRNKRRAERVGVRDRGWRNAAAYGTGTCGTEAGGTRRHAGQRQAERVGVRDRGVRNAAGAVRQCRGRRGGLCAVTARRGKTGRGCRESPAANPPGRRRGSCRTARAAPR